VSPVQIPVAALSLLSGIPADNPQGLPTGGKWPLLQTIGVFVGLPVGAMAVIVALVMLQSGTRRARGTSATAVFTGPQAGSVDAAARSGTGPLTESGGASGMHREIAQPDGGETAPSGQGLQDGGAGPGLQDGGAGPDPARPGTPGAGAAGAGAAGAGAAGATRLGSGGSGARW